MKNSMLNGTLYSQYRTRKIWSLYPKNKHTYGPLVSLTKYVGKSWFDNDLSTFLSISISTLSLSLYIYIYIYIYIYTLLSWGMSTLAKGLTAATRVMLSSSNELSTLVSVKAKCKQTKISELMYVACWLSGKVTV